MDLSVLLSFAKIIAVIAYLYGLFWIMGLKVRPVTIAGKTLDLSLAINVAGVVVAFGIIQLALTDFGGFRILNEFDTGLLYQACTMTMVALGLNLIYGFNGQFSLGQWGFYGIGAYAAADVTYRWVNGDSSGLIVLGVGTILAGVIILLVGRSLSNLRRMPVLSSFTLYLLGALVSGYVAVLIGRWVSPLLNPLLGTNLEPGPLAQGFWLQIIYFLAVVFAGIFAAEISFLFGLPVLSLGSDYFGIATLGFTIVVYTLMVNSDTFLPFPEMRGGRGMIGIPKLTTWFWAFLFMMAVIVSMRNLIRSSYGRAMISVREDEVAARAMGIDVAGGKLLAFVIGSLFAGLGGGVYAHYIGFLSPGTFDFLIGFNPMIIVVFGGLGSMTGTITASFGWIFFLEGMLRDVLGRISPQAPSWRYVLYPLTLLLLMLIRPEGLMGKIEWGFLKIPVVPLRDTKQEGEVA
ncbi:MAG: branched-chain amino acid ABC transporter permease [Anaerolineales bacterium]|nr:branched-chain amino acid ABC transporter permease [Anaerolineales bacterium]MCX7609276.1 branched-chain amino acid ABC transporter permease [Anaerolineales bacterium]MDW8226516.1 branched-chain amino acid ABC transporter permease [Anaerolineales bacterium]